MTRKLGLIVLASVLALGLSIPDADAKKVRGTQTCDADKVDRTIQGKKYSCTHCSNSICDEDANGQLANCGIEHTYKDCEEKAASRTQGLMQSFPEDMVLDPGPKVRKPKVFQTPGTLAPLAQ